MVAVVYMYNYSEKNNFKKVILDCKAELILILVSLFIVMKTNISDETKLIIITRNLGK